jgi:hypothetical protein
MVQNHLKLGRAAGVDTCSAIAEGGGGGPRELGCPPICMSTSSSTDGWSSVILSQYSLITSL